jgi:uncharacterized protein
MKKIGLAIVVLFCLFGLTAGAVFAKDYPKAQGYVSDFASLLSAQGKQQLESQLATLEKDTTVQIAVVTINSLEGNTIEGYASELFQAWGIGQKGKDNGVLFITSKEDRKVRIEVGYGLEPVITDGRAGRILDQNVLPEYKKENYEKGIIAGVNAIEIYARDGTPPAPLEENPLSQTGDWFFPVLIVITIIGMYLTGFMARSNNIWLGSIFGVLAGIALGLTIGGIAAIIIGAVISGGFGALFDFILSKTYKAVKSSGRSTSWFNTWGGFHGGGGGGGGFGGFGGGMSGGGGASRGW